MVFNSLTFLLFFLIVWLVHQAPLSWRAKKFNLLISSYLFYAAWNPPFVVLLWISTVVDWFAAKAMARSDRLSVRRTLLVASLVTNLGLLCVFKYGTFLLDNFVALLHVCGVAYVPPALDIILPVGISFYTFQTLSYTIDVYRGKLKPAGRFLDFALFVTFFPQLVAGPIVRAADFLPQCLEPKRADARHVGWGLVLLVLGLFEKVILADGILAPVADQVYNAAHDVGRADAWLGALAFSSQIFCDFAGYSVCAIGVAMCLGFRLPDNFRFPYAAIGFSDFWRRWHISLSGWLRDYLYISLGGNRCGKTRTYVNLMLTMLLGGLWHGASWRFVAWGGLHGLYLIVERVLGHLFGAPRWTQRWWGRFCLAMLTYVFVVIAWVFFRAQDFSTAMCVLKAMLIGAPDNFSIALTMAIPCLLVSLGLPLAHWFVRDSCLEEVWSRMPGWLRPVVLAMLLICLALAEGDDRAFIYFQF